MLQVVVILSTVIILLLLLGYSLDYKLHPRRTDKEMRIFGSRIFSWVLAIFCFYIILEASRGLVYFKDDMGYAYNAKRNELGLPLLGENWKKEESGNTLPFSVIYTNPKEKATHFKKLVTYDFLSAREETDYFRSNKYGGVGGIRIYDFKENKTDYLLMLSGTAAREAEVKQIDAVTFWHYFGD